VTDPVATVRRRARWMYWTFAITLAIVLAAVVITAALTQDAKFTRPSALFAALALPLTVAGLTGAVICMALMGDASGRLGLEPERNKRIRRAVHTLSAAELHPDDREATRDYSRMTTAIMRLQASQFLMLFAGLAATRVADISNPASDLHTFNVVFLVCMVVASAVAVPFVLHRARRLQTFADAIDGRSL
jgi:tellurite resistance protein TehA-like permease